ncbi:MAG: hypothetical protein GMKNLPBB_02477 [Myxococcota bacterium]|nr:hypothetical protein [Myxococcota bacterium]
MSGEVNQQYQAFLRKLDGFFAQVMERHAGHMKCRKGCAACCAVSPSFLPVEMDNLRRAFAGLPESLRQTIAAQAGAAAAGVRRECPMLVDNACSVYGQRPVICRTHGLPILFAAENGEKSLDHCPLNFEGVERIDGASILNLDQVNQILGLLNIQFDPEAAGERKNLAAAILEWEAHPSAD